MFLVSWDPGCLIRRVEEIESGRDVFVWAREEEGLADDLVYIWYGNLPVAQDQKNRSPHHVW